MGRPNGYEKAQRIAETIIRAIDRSATAAVVEPCDIEGAVNIRAFRGRLFDDRYTGRGNGKRVYTPKSEG